MKPVPPELAQRLWDAAPALFAEDGRFTMTRACDELQVPRATFYYYFAGKADLALFFAHRIISHAGAVAAGAAARLGPVPDRLRAALRAIYDLESLPPGVTRPMLRFITEHGAFLSILDELREIGFAPVRKLLVEGRDNGELLIGDIEVALVTLFGAIEIVVVTGLRGPGYLPSDAVDQAVDLLMRGLEAQPPRR